MSHLYHLGVDIQWTLGRSTTEILHLYIYSYIIHSTQEIEAS